ncbi:MAG: hydroxymethylbilane synthase [Nocardioidaceae bacterium]
MTSLKIGTRASTLARVQGDSVAQHLSARLGVDVELIAVTTSGDRSTAPLTQIGGQGVFVGGLREAVVAGAVDIAVHSLKDLPVAPDASVVLAAVPTREDARDALVARDRLTLGELPAGSRIGTGSPRRAAQLLALGLDVDVVSIRGNVETRVAKVRAGEYDAVVLARAGLSRLGRLRDITENLDPLQMLPAPGQGALAVEVAATAGELAADVRAALDDPDARAAVCAERAILLALDAGCSAPIGALAEIAEGDDGPEIWLRAVVCAHDGTHLVRRSLVGRPQAAEAVGRSLAEVLLADGAAELMKEPA